VLDLPVLSLRTALDVGPYRPGDEEGILDCMRVCFGLDRDVATWRHVYFENPSGPPIILLARDCGIVVGHESLVPRRVRAFGCQGLVGHNLWIMTRPEWRRRGLSRMLALEAIEQTRRAGFLATYAFANPQSLPGFVKHLGRERVSELPLLVRPVRPLRAALDLLRGRHRCGLPWAWSAPPDWTPPAFDERYTALFADAEALPPIAVVRDAAHLAWRYPAVAGSPYRQRDAVADGRLRATVVVRPAVESGVPFVFVMEWLWVAGARREAVRLMQAVVRLARTIGAAGVAALAMPGTEPRRVLRRLGFVGVPARLFPSGVTLTVRAESEGAWAAPASWYLTFGDGDVV
jgi:GNAT superfamily N-acetyltransferase